VKGKQIPTEIFALLGEESESPKGSEPTFHDHQ
jgi:hypothetical protein